MNARRSRGRRRGALAISVVIGLGVLSASACRHRDEVIAKTAEGKRLRADDIDRDPTALLPGGALGIATLDAPALYRSPVGQQLLALSRRRAPVPPSAQFDPERDLTGAVIGFYSMQGLDFAGIASGSFDPTAIERAADGNQTTPLGVPVVRTTYADHTLYTADNVGFVVLTAHTVLFGNETGIRRVLDRLARGRLRREIPAWAEDLLARHDAPFAAAMNLESNPVSESVRERLPFTGGLSRVRVVGNFEAPGVNLAGTAVYSDEVAAQSGAQQLNELQALAARWGWLATIAGIPQPVRQVRAQAHATEVDFVVGLDAVAVGKMIEQLSATLGAAPRGG
jgi:hypothetical protein